jgi:hypothetical protein
MISNLKSDSNSERTLTVNLNSRFTSIAWRMKVIHRLKGLLSAVTEYETQHDRKRVVHLAYPSGNTACLHGKSVVFVLFLIHSGGSCICLVSMVVGLKLFCCD